MSSQSDGQAERSCVSWPLQRPRREPPPHTPPLLTCRSTSSHRALSVPEGATSFTWRDLKSENALCKEKQLQQNVFGR